MAASAEKTTREQPAEEVIGNAVVVRALTKYPHTRDHGPCCVIPRKQYLEEPLRSKLMKSYVEGFPGSGCETLEPLAYIPVHGVPGEEHPKKIIIANDKVTISAWTIRLLETRSAWGHNLDLGIQALTTLDVLE